MGGETYQNLGVRRLVDEQVRDRVIADVFLQMLDLYRLQPTNDVWLDKLHNNENTERLT
jgi:hypothetical protein